MLHTCVRKFDVMVIVAIFLGSERGLIIMDGYGDIASTVPSLFLDAVRIKMDKHSSRIMCFFK